MPKEFECSITDHGLRNRTCILARLAMSSAPNSGVPSYWQIAPRPMAAYCAASVVAGFVVFPLWGLTALPLTGAGDFFALLDMGWPEWLVD